MCILQFRPKYYLRYVDNTFLMFESKNDVKKFLKYMISVTRINKLTTSLYRKKILSGVYLNSNSFLPMGYKKGLIHDLLFCVYNICADCITLHNEI